MIPGSLLDDNKRQIFFTVGGGNRCPRNTRSCRNFDDHNHSFYRRNNFHCYWFLILKVRLKTLCLCSHDYDLF